MKYTLFIAMASLCCSALSKESKTLIQNSGQGEMVSLSVMHEEEKVFLHSVTSSFQQDSSFPVTISHPERNVISIPLFSINKSGEGIAVWQSMHPLTSRIYVESAAYVAKLGWSSSRMISSENENIEPCSYELHLDENGYAAILWHNILTEPNEEVVSKTCVFKVIDFFTE